MTANTTGDAADADAAEVVGRAVGRRPGHPPGQLASDRTARARSRCRCADGALVGDTTAAGSEPPVPAQLRAFLDLVRGGSTH